MLDIFHDGPIRSLSSTIDELKTQRVSKIDQMSSLDSKIDQLLFLYIAFDRFLKRALLLGRFLKHAPTHDRFFVEEWNFHTV